MKKNNKKVANVQVANVQVAIEKQDNSFYKHVLANVDMFNNEQVDTRLEKVLTVNNANVNKIDVMSSSRIAFFKQAVNQLMSFNELARYDYRFYAQTNDRSKTQTLEKYECKQKACSKKDNTTKSFCQHCLTSKCENVQLSVSYSRKRTHKQLNDVCKLKTSQVVFNKHNLTITTSKQYEVAINNLLINSKKVSE